MANWTVTCTKILKMAQRCGCMRSTGAAIGQAEKLQGALQVFICYFVNIQMRQDVQEIKERLRNKAKAKGRALIVKAPEVKTLIEGLDLIIDYEAEYKNEQQAKN